VLLYESEEGTKNPYLKSAGESTVSKRHPQIDPNRRGSIDAWVQRESSVLQMIDYGIRVKDL